MIFYFQGIRGLSSNAFYENIAGKFKDQGDAISNSTTESEWNLGGSPKLFYVTADVYTSFVMLVGIFFPSCTGKLFSKFHDGVKTVTKLYFRFDIFPSKLSNVFLSGFYDKIG